MELDTADSKRSVDEACIEVTLSEDRQPVPNGMRTAHKDGAPHIMRAEHYARGIVEPDKSQIPIPHFSTTLEPREVLEVGAFLMSLPRLEASLTSGPGARRTSWRRAGTSR